MMSSTDVRHIGGIGGHVQVLYIYYININNLNDSPNLLKNMLSISGDNIVENPK
jgi:hypothetical protein